VKLLTKDQYDKLTPRKQGYVHYVQEAQQGSELRGLTNPYAEGTKQHKEWDEGQMAAVLDVQDEED
jgi:hypothetical protein